MTSWPDEKLAIENMLDKFGGPGKLFSVVMDSYDYNHALMEVFPSVTTKLKQTGATLVLRPDSGDPPTVVLQALRAADRFMGSRVNKLGYKVLNQTAVIQGDGISYDMLRKFVNFSLSLSLSLFLSFSLSFFLSLSLSFSFSSDLFSNEL
jgi:nicotinamide phosphoribosyltransferase